MYIHTHTTTPVYTHLEPPQLLQALFGGRQPGLRLRRLRPHEGHLRLEGGEAGLLWAVGDGGGGLVLLWMDTKHKRPPVV